MDIQKWLNEDKGGFGAFLIIVIVGLTFYALHREEPVGVYEASLSKTKQETSSRQVGVKNSLPNPPPSSSGKEDGTKPGASDSALAALGSVTEPVKTQDQFKTVSTKNKSKAKSTKRRLSKEEVVRSKLRAGMTVNQIAKATGYEKKYIRAIKKRKVCQCK